MSVAEANDDLPERGGLLEIGNMMSSGSLRIFRNQIPGSLVGGRSVTRDCGLDRRTGKILVFIWLGRVKTRKSGLGGSTWNASRTRRVLFLRIPFE